MTPVLLALLLSAAADPATTLYAVPEVGTGAAQSPINILTGQTERHRHRLRVEGPADGARVAAEPHAFRIDAVPGTRLSLDGEAFALAQCHYHTPSEHLIDGVTFPAEKHCVAEDEAGDYLVLATLYRMGEQDPTLGAALDAAGGGPAEALAQARLVSPETVRAHHYVYHGSLTTPPYTEAVSWVVSSRIETASPEQVERLNEAEGDNARHVQLLGERRVERD